MLYLVLGKEIEIFSMKKPENGHGSWFELEGDDALKDIGLNNKFWFRAPYFFTNEFPVSDADLYSLEPKNDYQIVLSFFIHKQFDMVS